MRRFSSPLPTRNRSWMASCLMLACSRDGEGPHGEGYSVLRSSCSPSSWPVLVPVTPSRPGESVGKERGGTPRIPGTTGIESRPRARRRSARKSVISLNRDRVVRQTARARCAATTGVVANVARAKPTRCVKVGVAWQLAVPGSPHVLVLAWTCRPTTITVEHAAPPARKTENAMLGSVCQGVLLA